MTHAAIVLAGGDPVEPALEELLPGGAYVVAADSGLHAAAVLGLHVDRLVGDLDSADPAAVEIAVESGTVVDRHPAAKDATDLELALHAADAHGARRIVLVGGAGGRLDHLLANLLLLASPDFAHLEIEAYVGEAHVVVTHGGRPPVELHGDPGSVVTLLAAWGPARGVVTDGLLYALARDDLPAGTTRGVSNVLLGTTATVALEAGTLLVVQPCGGGK